MARVTYTDEERAEWLELASEIGITRAMRELGYPASWNAGSKWVKAAGIEVPIDAIKAQAAEHNAWYGTEELMLIAQEGLQRAKETLANAGDLSADDQKKLAEAVQKYSNTMLTLMGKASSITERRTENLTPDLAALYDNEFTRNMLIETEGDKSYEDLEVSH